MRRTVALAKQLGKLGYSVLTLGAIAMPVALAQDVTVPEPETGLEQQADPQSAEGTVVREDDWDWDWEETTVTPAYRDDVGKSSKRTTKTTQSPAEPRVGETAEPDFARDPLRGQLLFAGVSRYGVIPSKKDPEMHPCANCHAWAKSNREPRKLQEPHDNIPLQHGLHGKGEFWCFTCHHLDGNGGIQTLKGERLAFDDAYIVCAQCHPREARDWSFGAHGKRVENWGGERRILN